MLKISCIGHLGQDATINQVSGKNVINFSVADTEKFKNKDGQEVSKTVWVNCSYWTERVTVKDFLKKGTLVFIDGKPEVKIYVDKNNESQPQLHMRVSTLQLLSSKQD
jgi:single-strand DNA-binding protein